MPLKLPWCLFLFDEARPDGRDVRYFAPWHERGVRYVACDVGHEFQPKPRCSWRPHFLAGVVSVTAPHLHHYRTPEHLSRKHLNARPEKRNISPNGICLWRGVIEWLPGNRRVTHVNLWTSHKVRYKQTGPAQNGQPYPSLFLTQFKGNIQNVFRNAATNFHFFAMNQDKNSFISLHYSYSVISVLLTMYQRTYLNNSL